jgi:putative endonuclease
MTTRGDLGAFGERVAAHRLEAAGMAILARNVRVPGGEIDLLCRMAPPVCVEVRTRRSAPDRGGVRFATARAWRAALAYATARGSTGEPARRSVVIDLGPGGEVAHTAHLRAIELPDDT